MTTDDNSIGLHPNLQAQRHNAQQPVSGIPSEILECIFHYLVPPLPSSKDVWVAEDLCVLTHRDLIDCSQVCSHWRNVAIHSPTLWGRIWISDRLGSCSLLDMVSQRAREVPLEIAVFEHPVLHTSRPAGPLLNPLLKFSQVFSGSLAHIKTLCISAHIPINHTCMHFLELPAPQLEYFSMRTTVNWVSRNDFEPPPSFIANCSPVLRRLNVESGDFSWNCSIFRNLTTLEVQPL